jgi:hypothetical protein
MPAPTPVTIHERDRVLRDTFSKLAQMMLESRHKLIDLNSPEAKARLDRLYPRMHWLYYDGFIHPIGRWRPAYYGLPPGEHLLEGTDE